MRISREKETPLHLRPVVKVTGNPGRQLTQWELTFWRRKGFSSTEYAASLSNTGYTWTAWFDSSNGTIVMEFTGNTFSKEHLPPFCITGDTKFVDKFSDLAPLTDDLITRIWDNLIAFIATLPQPGDRGYEAYIALQKAYETSNDDNHKFEIKLLTSQVDNSDLKHENQKLKKQLEEIAIVKAQLTEAQTALKVVTGLLGKN
jgi:hypothetical protein